MNNLPLLVQEYIGKRLGLMDGWCTEAKAVALAESVLETKPRLCVEIGVYAARSLIVIALAQAEVVPDGVVFGIDPWDAVISAQGTDRDPKDVEWWGKVDHERIYQKARASIAEHNLDKRIILFRTTSENLASHSAFSLGDNLSPNIDLLHIDGNHSEAHSCHDVTAFVPLVRQGGIVVFDDTNWSTTKKAQVLLAEHCDLIKKVEGPGVECGWFRKR